MDEKKKISNKQLNHLEFLSKGLACHALCLLEYADVLDDLKKNEAIQENKLKKLGNYPLLKSAFVTLVEAGVLIMNEKTYRLTSIGRDLVNNIGLIYLPLVGYRNLLAKQYTLLNSPNKWKDAEIDYTSIALSSIKFGIEGLDPTILEALKVIKPKGSICDLGCGTAEKLARLCKGFNVGGLGIEKDQGVIQESKKFTKYMDQVEVSQGDIIKLDGVWEDVDIVMTSMVYHDIMPSETCVQFLRSLHIHFPKMRYLVIADIVSPSEHCSTSLPGFDYVHGLQGIIPRTYEETMQTFTDGEFVFFQKKSVPNIPNMFVWTIQPKSMAHSIAKSDI